MHMFQGTGVAVITPFNASHQVDREALQRLIAYLIDDEVDYLVILGTTGETATLSDAEQHQVIEWALEAAAGRVPVVLGASGNHTLAVAARIEDWSHRYQPAGLLSASPYYNKPNQEGIYQHYKALAASTDLPLILYNVPGRTASNVSADTTLRLAHDFGHIVAIKEASGNLEQCMNILRHAPAGFALLSGDDALSLPLISLGALGTISVTANAFPGAFARMVRLALAGDYAQARALHYRLLPFIDLNFREGNPAGVKALLQALHLCSDQVRLPLVPASASLHKAIERALNEAPVSRMATQPGKG
ncbi:MAG: 4-hydroxy-tetrahydrodipicolinate synthase [Bacteroidia bacterium]